MAKSFLDAEPDEEPTVEVPVVEPKPDKEKPPKAPSKLQQRIKELQDRLKAMDERDKNWQVKILEISAANDELEGMIRQEKARTHKAEQVLQELESQFAQASALTILENVRKYMWANRTEPLVAKCLKHLPPNDEWKGTMPRQRGRQRGGGWSGAWKDFCALFEKMMRSR